MNLKEGYNGDLTSREAGSIGGQMVKKMYPIQLTKYIRESRTAAQHQVVVSYVVGLVV